MAVNGTRIAVFATAYSFVGRAGTVNPKPHTLRLRVAGLGYTSKKGICRAV